MKRRVLCWLAMAVAVAALMAEPAPESTEVEFAASLWGVKLVAAAVLALAGWKGKMIND